MYHGRADSNSALIPQPEVAAQADLMVLMSMIPFSYRPILEPTGILCQCEPSYEFTSPLLSVFHNPLHRFRHLPQTVQVCGSSNCTSGIRTRHPDQCTRLPDFPVYKVQADKFSPGSCGKAVPSQPHKGTSGLPAHTSGAQNEIRSVKNPVQTSDNNQSRTVRPPAAPGRRTEASPHNDLKL